MVICSYCVLDRPLFERCQTLLHPELTPWWSFLLADGAHHKKPHSPTHPNVTNEHDDANQYGSFAVSSEIMPCLSYPVSLMNQYKIPVDQVWGQFHFFNSIPIPVPLFSIPIPIPLLTISFNSNSRYFNSNSRDFKSNLKSRNDLLKSSAKLIIIMITRYM